jgi:hypothetical protein
VSRSRDVLEREGLLADMTSLVAGSEEYWEGSESVALLDKVLSQLLKIRTMLELLDFKVFLDLDEEELKNREVFNETTQLVMKKIIQLM